MTALEMTQQVLREKGLKKDESDLVLHEAILGGALQRPIHYSELVLDVTLKWGSWGEEDRRDNYLLLKRNILYEEAIGMPFFAKFYKVIPTYTGAKNVRFYSFLNFLFKVKL